MDRQLHRGDAECYFSWPVDSLWKIDLLMSAFDSLYFPLWRLCDQYVTIEDHNHYFRLLKIL